MVSLTPTLSLVEMVKDKTVKFSYYRENELWYETEDGFLFPVPISDTSGATFLAQDKAILFMRYIKKHIKTVESWKPVDTE